MARDARRPRYFFDTALRRALFRREVRFRSTLPEPPSRFRLYHYTSAEGVRGIVSDCSIWLTNAAYVNDEQELTYPVRMARDVLRGVMEDADAPLMRGFLNVVGEWLDSYVGFKSWYVASFSQSGNALSQWRAYCPTGGYSLGFDGKRLVRAVREVRRFSYGPVAYDSDQQRSEIRAVIDRHVRTWREMRPLHNDVSDTDYNADIASLLAFSLGERLAFIKAPAFAEEREWRLAKYQLEDDEVLFRTRAGILTPYMRCGLTELPLTELYVGPLADIELAEHAARLLLGIDHPDVSIHTPEYKLRF